MMFQFCYLEPKFSRARSYYRRAGVITHENGSKELQSYNTIVVKYDAERRAFKFNGWYSATTARHINEFVHQIISPENKYGFRGLSKREIETYAKMDRYIPTIEIELRD